MVSEKQRIDEFGLTAREFTGKCHCHMVILQGAHGPLDRAFRPRGIQALMPQPRLQLFEQPQLGLLPVSEGTQLIDQI